VAESSLTLEHKILSGDDIAARARTVLGMVDPETGDSRPMPESLRTGLE
jgi:acyl-CoA thioesterase FadM